MNLVTANLLYLVFALGGAGLYFLLPQGRESRQRAGATLGAMALLGWIIVAGLRLVGGSSGAVYFLLLSVIALAASVRVITHRQPVYSAVYFVLVVVAVAGLLILQHAEFLAVALIIIYAGAIMVTYLFVIMLAQQSSAPVYDLRAREPFAAVLVGFVLMAAIATRAAGPSPVPSSDHVKTARWAQSPVAAEIPRTGGSAAAGDEVGNTAAMGAAIMTKYVVVLEIAGVLLLVSMIGAIGLSRKRVPMEGHGPAPAPLGQIGREVPPF